MSDRGQNFLSKIVNEVCKLFQITRLHTSSYHPQTNAQCERFNSTIAQSIRAYCVDRPTNWSKALPGIAAALRTVPSTQTTLFSPFFILFKQESRLPIDTLLIPNDLATTARPCMEEIIKSAELTKEIVSENIEKARIKNKEKFDAKAKPFKFQLGQKVWLTHTHKTPGISPKLQSKFIGPYYISKILQWDTYIIRNCATNKQLKSPINASRLKAYQSPSERPTNQLDDEPGINGTINEDNNISHDQAAENSQTTNENAEVTNKVDTETINKENDLQENTNDQSEDTLYIVNKLVSSKIINKTRHYKVKWLGYRECTWEPEYNLPDHLIQEFHINKTMTGKNRKRTNKTKD